MSYISINNITYTKTTTINKLKIEPFNLCLFESCSFNVFLFDENDNLIDLKTVILNGDEYELWNNDDSYIIEWVKSKLNLN